MKKSMIALASALVACTLFAEDPAVPPPCPDGNCAPAEVAPAPAPDAVAPKAPHGEHAKRAPRMQRQAPLMIQVTDKTTPEEIEAFKQQVLARIDQSVADYKAKPAVEGQEKPALQLGLMSGLRGGHNGMRGPRGQRNLRGPGKEGQRGPHGDKGPQAKPEGAGELPPPPAEAPAPEAK